MNLVKLKNSGFSRQKLIIGIATLCSVALAVYVLFNVRFVIDTFRYYTYTASSEFTNFAARTTLTDRGKFLLFSAQPKLQEAKDFNKDCTKTEITTAVLGCYDGQSIYIYNVNNSELDGIKEVTTAHEMLHAAYDRLPRDERKRIDALLDAEYQSRKDDPAFARRFEMYDRIEPGQRHNELHSIIGTETRDISPALENYYKKYFSDRSRVVTLRDTYSQVFDRLSSRADELTALMRSIESSITDDKQQYEQQLIDLQQDIDRFNSRIDNRQISSMSAYESERSVLLARSSNLDAFRQRINDYIEQYNLANEELKSISIRADALNKSIDSTLAPTPTM